MIDQETGDVATPKGRSDATTSWALATSLALTFLALIGFVGLIWLSALQSSVDGVTTSSGARAAIFALSASFVLSVFVRRLIV